MNQLLPGLRRLAVCSNLLLVRSSAAAVTTSQPAITGAEFQAHGHCAAAAESSCSPAGRSAAPASTVTLNTWLRPCQSQHCRQASGAAASTSSAVWGTQQRGLHLGTTATATAGVPAQVPEGTAAGPAAPPQMTPGRIQNKPMPPWTPTRELKKRNFLPRRMGYMIKTLEQEAYDKALQEKKYPKFWPGDVVEVKLALPENQRRTIPVRGIVIAIRNRGIRTSFTLLNNITGGGNIERSFPLFCPTIQELKIVQKQKIRARRAKLYYLRDRKPTEFKV